jgi:hypothetical protein
LSARCSTEASMVAVFSSCPSAADGGCGAGRFGASSSNEGTRTSGGLRFGSSLT